MRTCGVVRYGAAGRGSEASGGGRRRKALEADRWRSPSPRPPTPPDPHAGESLAGTQISPVAGPLFPRHRSHQTSQVRADRPFGFRHWAPRTKTRPTPLLVHPRALRNHPSAESAVAAHVSGEEPCDWLSEEDGLGRRLPWTWRSPQATSSSSQPMFPPLDRFSACQVKVRNPSASRGVVSALRPTGNVSGLLTQSSQRQDQNNTVEWRSTQSPLPSEGLPLQNRVY